MSYTKEEILAATELFPTLWILQHQLLNEVGLPLEFEQRRFLWDIFNDMSPLQVILKAPQIGMTTTHIIKALYIAKKQGKQLLYTLPTSSDMYEMVGSTFNRLIAQNQVLRDWVKEGDTMEHKYVGNSVIRFRGTFTAKQAMMIPSDLNIHDEVDASDPEVITLMETRLQAKADGMRWYFSHPSLAGHGVDVYWQKSDKKEWYITCNECKKEQTLSWPESVNSDIKSYVCKHCGRSLSDSERARGQWIPTAQGEFSGYHVSQLMCPWISATKIIEAYNDPLKDKQYFWNYVLGLPYVASDDIITPEQVLKNCVPVVNDMTDRVIIGVDTGLPIHVTLLNKQGAFYYGTCDNYIKIEDYLRRWPNSVVVSDQGGDLIGIRELQAKYPGRVFLCYYRKDKKSLDVIKWGEGNEFGQVVVDRNRMLTLIVEQLRDVGRLRLNGAPEDWRDFAAHFGNIWREQVVVKEVKDKDDRSLYGAEYVWKRNGPDHFVHSLLYALVGFDKFQESKATIIGENMFGDIPIARIF